MLDVTNIHPLTEFARNTREHIERLQKSGKAEVLTVNGKAAVVIQDAEAYQQLLKQLDYAESVRSIQRALDALNNGDEGHDAKEFLKGIERERTTLVQTPSA